MTPISYTKELWETQAAKIKELESHLKLLSESYLRLRSMIPGAYNTPTAPTAEQVYSITESALEKFIKDNIHD